VLGALLLVSLTVKRQALGWQLLVRGERAEATVVSMNNFEYGLRIPDGRTVHIRKAPDLMDILTDRWADVGDNVHFYWLAGKPQTARLVRFPLASTLAFVLSGAFLLMVPVAVAVGRRKAQREGVA
jgi:hypothetical protein